MKEKKQQEQEPKMQKPEIDRSLQIAMMNFFLKTSAPRILKQRNSKSDFNMKECDNDEC